MSNQSSGDGSIGYIVLYCPVREKNIFYSSEGKKKSFWKIIEM